MNSEQEDDIVDSLDEISNDYDENGTLDVGLANEFIEKLISLSINETVINDVAQTFVNIYNGSHHTKLDDDTAAESAKARLFAGIQSALSKAIGGLGKKSSTTTTQSVKSKLQIEIQENGAKILTWDFNWTKAKTSTPKKVLFIIN